MDGQGDTELDKSKLGDFGLCLDVAESQLTDEEKNILNRRAEVFAELLRTHPPGSPEQEDELSIRASERVKGSAEILERVFEAAEAMRDRVKGGSG